MQVSRNAGDPKKIIHMTEVARSERCSTDPNEYASLQDISDKDAEILCEKLRWKLLDTVSRTGGHLASNLGVVELTVAIHRVFDTSRDRLVFDVGHQCYVHKILTGRAGKMGSLRCFGGIAGFPKPSESDHDAFIAGHASNAVSVAYGMAAARTRMGEHYHVVALLGDGAFTGGLSYEGLSSAGQSGEPLIVILNDNGMSITENVGGVANLLARQRLKPQYFNIKKWYRKVMLSTPMGRGVYRFTHRLKAAVKAALLPGSMFEEMGFQYMGPVDGHDIKTLTRLLQQAREINGPVVLHVKTVKGKGYAPAERNPDEFHGIGAFHKDDGALRHVSSEKNFSSVFGNTLTELAREDSSICAITAAMGPGTGLSDFAKEFPDRFFDVGIAEGHAVTMAAGMAKQGLNPVFAVYSTFFQRSYDMLIHDVAILNLHVVFCVDRAGLVGDDGETHHGIFDVAFLNTVPGMTVLCPSNKRELSSMMKTGIQKLRGPVAIRYPRGSEGAYVEDNSGPLSVYLRKGSDITLVSYGMMINPVLEAVALLEKKGIRVEVIKLNQITPLDASQIVASVRKTGRILLVEDVIAMGSVGERVFAELASEEVLLKGAAQCNCGDGFVPHGTVPQLHSLCGLDVESIAERAREVCSHGGEKALGRAFV